MTHGDLLDAKELSPENSIVKKHRHPKEKGDREEFSSTHPGRGWMEIPLCPLFLVLGIC
jgi:hypothetical protein